MHAEDRAGLSKQDLSKTSTGCHEGCAWKALALGREAGEWEGGGEREEYLQDLRHPGESQRAHRGQNSRHPLGHSSSLDVSAV